MRILFTMLCAAAGFAAAAPSPKDPKPSKAEVRLLEIKIEGEAKGKVTEPFVMKMAGDAAKAMPTPDLAKEVDKAVDYNKEQIVYFSWAGSGGDKITASVGEGDKANEVTFTVTRGLTRDLRQHHKLFAIPQGAKFKVVTSK